MALVTTRPPKPDAEAAAPSEEIATPRRAAETTRARAGAAKSLGLDTRGRETRQRIVEAVWDVLAENGYAGMTVRLVGQRAGVSHAMIHYYFSTKDDLLLAVVEHARRNWIHPLEDWVRGSGTSTEKLENIIVWMAEPATREVMRVHRQLLAQTEWNEDLRQAMATEYMRWRAGFADLFRQLDVDGLLSDGTDIDLLAAAFSTASDSLVSKRALEPGLDSEAIMREMLRPFLTVPVTPVVGGASREARDGGKPS